jgi:hypothetical protein
VRALCKAILFCIARLSRSAFNLADIFHQDLVEKIGEEQDNPSKDPPVVLFLSIYLINLPTFGRQDAPALV